MNTYADRLLDLTFRVPGWAIAAASAGAAAGLGWAYVNHRSLALLPALVLLSLPLVLSAWARVVVVVFGGLTVFQSSDELTSAKMLYLFALGVSFGAILVRLPTLRGTPAFRDLTPLLRASIVTFVLVALSLPVSALNEVPQKDWLRDVAPYVMVACAPFFALDAQASMSAKALRKLLVLGGVLGALGFTARWLTNRDLADLSFIPVGLPTLLLASTAFAYGIAVLLHGERRRLAWAALTSFVFAMLLSTGTRTALILLAAPLAIVAGSRHRLAQRTLRLLVAVPVVALLVVLSAQAVVSVTNADRDALATRAELLFTTGDTRTDYSYLDRLAQTAASWEAFRSAPLLGTGPGKPFVWTDAFNQRRETTTVDSSVSFVAKFGLAGLVALAFLVVGFFSSLRRFRARTGQPTVIQFTLVGFGAVVAAWTLLHNPYEDKGLALGLILLFAAAAREASDADDAARTERPPARTSSRSGP
jgi:O-antigen ligase